MFHNIDNFRFLHFRTIKFREDITDNKDKLCPPGLKLSSITPRGLSQDLEWTMKKIDCIDETDTKEISNINEDNITDCLSS